MNTPNRATLEVGLAQRLAMTAGVNRIYRAALSHSTLDDIGKVVLEVARERTGAAIGFFCLFDPVTGNIQKTVTHACAEGLTADYVDFFREYVFPARRAEGGAHTVTLPAPRAGCDILLHAPVCESGKVIAGLFLLVRAASDLTPDADAVMTELSAVVALVLKSKCAQAALHMRQRYLVAELQHRVRNLLTVVRSVFNRTVEGNGTREDLFDHFRGRLDALARTQAIVTSDAEGHADLEDLIRGELLSVGAASNPNVLVSGPEIRLPTEAAESMGLAIHELTTNALKYGALQTAGASLDIRWSVAADSMGAPQLNLHWTERGVPMVAVNPRRSGFGRELIEDALPYRLGARTDLEFRGGGIRCHISMPLPGDGQRLYG